MKEVGRNDPCPCGSGKKYKKCCALKTPLQKRTFTAVSPEASKSSMERITGMMSKTIRNIPTQPPTSLKNKIEKASAKPDEEEPPAKEDVEPKSGS